MTLHVGVIGTGHWSRTHLAALQHAPHAGRVTLCGRNARRAAELASEFPKVTASVDEPQRLWDDPSVDVIDIVLPHHLHVPTTLQALAAGKHVICEKPSATSISDFDRVTAAAERAGRRALVVMNQLYSPRLQRVRQRVAEGLLGRPFLLVENAYSNHSAAYHEQRAWRTRVAKSGGGVLIDGGFHMVYKQLALLAPFGPPRWVTAETAQLNLDPAGRAVAELGEDFAAYTIGFDASLRVSASHCWTLESSVGRTREGFLAGSLGTLEMSEGIEGPVAVRRGGRQEELPLPEPLADPRCDTLRPCLADYLVALSEDRPPTHGDRALARQTLEVILAAYESSRRGERVALG